MYKLASNRDQVESSSKDEDMIRSLFFDDWKSKTHKQFQNYSERKN